MFKNMFEKAINLFSSHQISSATTQPAAQTDTHLQQHTVLFSWGHLPNYIQTLLLDPQRNLKEYQINYSKDYIHRVQIKTKFVNYECCNGCSPKVNIISVK